MSLSPTLILARLSTSFAVHNTIPQSQKVNQISSRSKYPFVMQPAALIPTPAVPVISINISNWQ